MQNQDEGPRYTDPGHPYSGSDGRYQNQYSTRSRRPADKPFQFPWWAIVIPFCIGMWPVGIAFIIMNKLMKEGKMADLEERARQRTSQFTHTSRTTTGSDGRTAAWTRAERPPAGTWTQTPPFMAAASRRNRLWRPPKSRAKSPVPLRR